MEIFKKKLIVIFTSRKILLTLFAAWLCSKGLIPDSTLTMMLLSALGVQSAIDYKNQTVQKE